MDELLQQFVIEAAELTQQAADDLLGLDRDPGNLRLLESAFRALHTLKGSVGLFGLAPMHTALHAAEDVLGTVREEAGELDPARIDPLLAIIEWTDRCVEQLARSGDLPAEAITESAALVLALGAGDKIKAIAPPVPATIASVAAWATSLFDAHADLHDRDLVAIRYQPHPECFFSGDDPLALMDTVPDMLAARISTRDPWAEPAVFDPFRSNLVIEALSGAAPREVEAVFRLIPDQATLVPRARSGSRPLPPEAPGPADIDTTVRTLRVEVERIDRLVDVIGELFTAKNAMSHLVRQARALEGGEALARNIAVLQQDLDRLAGQMQRTATGVRMAPLNDTLRRLPRLVRETSRQTGKQVDIAISGGEVEADKAIVDGLFDPLLHIIRNAIDHGIESESQRDAAGKPRRGMIRVAAGRVGYRVELEVSDDGSGIDSERVRAAAVSRGVVSQKQAEELAEEEVLELLFTAGLSTADAVTDVSGRGVGMDAIRASVQRLGGRVGISSTPGLGTIVSLSVPTRFALSRILLVEVAGDRYGIQMDAIAETMRVPASAIVPVRSGEAVVLRGRTIPLLRLARLLGTTAHAREGELLVVTEVASGPVALAIDDIGERFETMLRPPAGLLRTMPGIAGTCVLGDGAVAIVLDLEALVE